MLAVQPVLNIFMVWIYIVQNGVSIGLMRCGENDNLKILVCFLKALHDIGPNINTDLDYLFVWKIDLKDDVWLFCIDIVDTMNQSLIHVKDNRFGN